MKPFIAIALGIILLLPSVMAYNCNLFTGINKDNCIALNDTNEDMIANLIYTNHTYPDFNSIESYNSRIQITNAPIDTSTYSRNYIKNAWISIIDVNPSIIYENNTFVPSIINVRTEYDYNIQIPPDYSSNKKQAGQTCKIYYSKNSESQTFKIYSNELYQGNTKKLDIEVTNDTTIKSTLDITVTVKADYYEWISYYDNGYLVTECDYDKTEYYPEILSIQDTQNLKYDNQNMTFDAVITGIYHNTTRGELSKDQTTSISLHLGNSSYSENEFEYYATFKKSPYYLLQLEAVKNKKIEINNMYYSNNTFYVSDASNCEITGYNFFYQTTKTCSENITQEQPIAALGITPNLTLLFMIAVLIFILYMMYKGVKHYWTRYAFIIILAIVVIPNVSAADCGLTNLASCIPQAIFDFLTNLINAPLQPLLELFKNLLSNAPNIDMFINIWAIIVYCISIFYSFLLIYSGFQFLFAGHSVVRREMAKEWLKNTVLMIVLIQGSFYLYQLILDIGSITTTAILSITDPTFFQLTADNITNVGLDFIFTLVYVLVLVATVLYLTIRYLAVCIGVIFFPIGLFCYFIPPLKSYGKLILNLLGMMIFVTVLDAVVILACSKFLDIAMFQNFKILIMIACLLIVDLITLILAWHIITKTGIDSSAGQMTEAIKYIAMT